MQKGVSLNERKVADIAIDILTRVTGRSPARIWGSRAEVPLMMRQSLYWMLRRALLQQHQIATLTRSSRYMVQHLNAKTKRSLDVGESSLEMLVINECLWEFLANDFVIDYIAKAKKEREENPSTGPRDNKYLSGDMRQQPRDNKQMELPIGE